LSNTNEKRNKTISVYEYAKLYLTRGLSVIPLKPKAKEPLIPWKEFQERIASEKEIEEWFKDNTINIGIICGAISDNLFVIDFDNKKVFKIWYDLIDKNYPDVRDIVLNTWNVETGRGVHIYFRADVDKKTFKELFRTKPKLIDGVDIKGEGGYVVAPPSIHPSGKLYEFILGPYEGIDIAKVDLQTYKRIIQSIEDIGKTKTKQNGKKGKKKSSIGSRELTKEQISSIIEVLKPYYKEGYRDAIIYTLIGALIKNGYSYESARGLVEAITTALNDEEKDHRLYLVDYHYGKRVKEIGIEKLKGISGIREAIEKEVFEETHDVERAKDEALEVVSKLNEILGIFIEPKALLVPLKTGSSSRQFYANDPDRGILILTKRGNDITREYIFGYYIEKVIIYVNPSDPRDMVYTVYFKHPKTGDILPFEERTIGDIAKQIEETSFGVRNVSKLKSAISSLIEGFRAKALAEIRNKIPATGLFEIDGELGFFESPKFKINLPEPNSEKAKEALKQLEELLAFWDYKDHVIGNLYNDVQAPLGYIRKLYGRENKIIFNYGEPHVGKTLREKIYCALWGLDESKAIIGSSNLTPAQIAEYLNSTTFKVVFDEARNILLSPYTVDMLKNSTTNLHVKSRILPQMGYRLIEFYAYASISMNTNYVEINYPGVEDRLIPFKWTVADKKDPKVVEEFLKKFESYKDNLRYIGAYLKDMFIRRWGEIKQIIINNDNIEAGRKILEMMYEELGLEKPSWLKPIEVKYEIDTPRDEDVFFNFIREELQNAIARQRYVMVTHEDDSGYREDRIDLLEAEWEDRLRYMAKTNMLPSFMALGRDNVYIFTTIIKEIRRKKGHEIAGGLENLALRLGYKYIPYKGQKAMVIPIFEFIERMKQVVEVEEIEESKST